jgi:hypothetical protein
MHKLVIIAAIGALAIGCKKKEEGGAASGGGDKDKGGDTAGLPALTADPVPTDIKPSEKPPFEAVKFRMLAKRDNNGWPTWEAYNLGTKPIGFLALYGYAYDKDGKQLARTKVPLSWNGKLAPGGKTDWSIQLGGSEKVPAGAASYAICYNSIKFEGDADQTADNKLCPEQMPKK